jgi:hypothetical protein
VTLIRSAAARQGKIKASKSEAIMKRFFIFYSSSNIIPAER